MTLTIELTREQEARLHEAARQQGIEPADVLVALMETLPTVPSMPAPFYETATPDEWTTAFTKWAESHGAMPRVPASAFSREADYEDRL